jgi:hypothetical protein
VRSGDRIVNGFGQDRAEAISRQDLGWTLAFSAALNSVWTTAVAIKR